MKFISTHSTFAAKLTAITLLAFTTNPVWSNETSDSQIEYGKANKFLDASDWYTPGSLLSKALLADKTIDSHQISPKTITRVRRYLDEHDMRDVKVRVNQYDPKGEWQRLKNNNEMGAGWRYTIGLASVVGYTLIPSRVFGGDHYNPYTNTIHLFSDNYAVALHEAAHARDQKQRKYKGSYAATYALPGASLYHEAVASKDVTEYVKRNPEAGDIDDVKKTLYPAYGTYVGALFEEPSAIIVGAVAGHILARTSKTSPNKVTDLSSQPDDQQFIQHTPK